MNMTHSNSYHLAMAAFHSAIDYEQENKNEEAYKKYVEGLALVSSILKNEVDSLHLPNIANMHKHMLEFAKRSTDRLLMILQKIGTRESNSEPKHGQNSRHNDDDNFVMIAKPSPYQILSDTLPEIRTNTPSVPVNFLSETTDVLSPLTTLGEDNQRIIRNYEKIIDSLLDVKAKANLRLELQRKLVENDTLARKRYVQWEEERKALAEECQQIAKQKFFIQDRINTGEINDSDFTKQNLYAACLQYHKEHSWAQELSCKIFAQKDDNNYIKKIISSLLQHKSHPLACMLRQIQEKVLNKLSRLGFHHAMNKSEKAVLEEHFKSIVHDIKEDLFTFSTVIQALWESLANETNQLIVIDVLHHLYFPPIKAYLIQILKILLRDQEEELGRCMAKNIERSSQYPSNLNPIIARLHQLPFLHSPTAMMSFLVEILRSFVKVSCSKSALEEPALLSVSIDDVMPKLIQFILISNMSTLPAEITFIENFMPAKKALGEEGYAVTLIQSILSYIYNNSASFDFSKP